MGSVGSTATLSEKTCNETNFVTGQQFSTGVLQEFLKHAIPDCVVRGTDLFSLRLSNKNNDTANTTIAIQCE